MNIMVEFTGNSWKMRHAEGNSVKERHIVGNSKVQCRCSVRDKFRKCVIKKVVSLCAVNTFPAFHETKRKKEKKRKDQLQEIF